MAVSSRLHDGTGTAADSMLETRGHADLPAAGRRLRCSGPGAVEGLRQLLWLLAPNGAAERKEHRGKRPQVLSRASRGGAAVFFLHHSPVQREMPPRFIDRQVEPYFDREACLHEWHGALQIALGVETGGPVKR